MRYTKNSSARKNIERKLITHYPFTAMTDSSASSVQCSAAQSFSRMGKGGGGGGVQRGKKKVSFRLIKACLFKINELWANQSQHLNCRDAVDKEGKNISSGGAGRRSQKAVCYFTAGSHGNIPD